MTVIIMDEHGERREDLRELESIKRTEVESDLDFRPYMHMETIYEPAQKGKRKMSGNEYVAQLEWQVENQQRIIRGLEADIERLEAELETNRREPERVRI